MAGSSIPAGGRLNIRCNSGYKLEGDPVTCMIQDTFSPDSRLMPECVKVRDAADNFSTTICDTYCWQLLPALSITLTASWQFLPPLSVTLTADNFYHHLLSHSLLILSQVGSETLVGNGADYTGTKDSTVDGRRCMSWNKEIIQGT